MPLEAAAADQELRTPLQAPQPISPWMDRAFRPMANDNRMSPRMEEVLRRMETAGPLSLTKPAPGMQVTKATVANLNTQRRTQNLPPLAPHTQGDGGFLRNDQGERVTNEGFEGAIQAHEERLNKEGGGKYAGTNMEPQIADALRNWHLLPSDAKIGFFLEYGGREMLAYLHGSIVQQALEEGRIQSPKQASAILPGVEWVGYPVLMLKKGPYALGAVTQATLDPTRGVSTAEHFKAAIEHEQREGRTPLYMAVSTPGNPGLSLSHDEQCALAKLAAEKGLYLILDTFYEPCMRETPTSNLALMQAELPPEVMERVIRMDGTTKWGHSEDKTAWAVATAGKGAELLTTLRTEQIARAAASSPHLLAKLFAAVDMRQQGFEHVGELRQVLGERMRQMMKILEESDLAWMSSQRSYYAAVEVPASRGAGNGATPTVDEIFTATGIGFAGMQDFGPHPEWKHFGRFSAANSGPTVDAIKNLTRD